MKRSSRDLVVLLFLGVWLGAAMAIHVRVAEHFLFWEHLALFVLYLAVVAVGRFAFRDGRRRIYFPGAEPEEVSGEEQARPPTDPRINRVLDALEQLQTRVDNLGHKIDGLPERSRVTSPSAMALPSQEGARAGDRETGPTPAPLPSRGTPVGVVPRAHRYDPAVVGRATGPPADDRIRQEADHGAPSAEGQMEEAWHRLYKRGYFRPAVLREVLDELGIGGEVIGGIGEDDEVLGVDIGDGRIYLLPSFTKTAKAVDQWFDAVGGGGRKALVRGLVRPAVLRRGAPGSGPERRGQVE